MGTSIGIKQLLKKNQTWHLETDSLAPTKITLAKFSFASRVNVNLYWFKLKLQESAQPNVINIRILPNCERHQVFKKKKKSLQSRLLLTRFEVNLPVRTPGGSSVCVLRVFLLQASCNHAGCWLWTDISLCWAGFSILHDYLFVTAGEWWHSGWSPATFTVTYLSLWILPVCQVGA